jgi:hypothetical protein
MNSLVANVALQLMLLAIPVVFATFLSQIINMALGYLLYGKLVFKVSRLRSRSLRSFACVSLFIWRLNWFGIVAFVFAGSTKNVAALVLLPLLPIASYFLQKHVVFSR